MSSPKRFRRAAVSALVALAPAAQASVAYAQESSSNLFAPAQTSASQQAPATGTSSNPGDASKNGVEYHGNGEHVISRGHHSLPPGYQEAPSVEFHHGPDPDHEANVVRDSVTGADLSKFGSAYQNSSPVQQGSLGDTNGNGWVAPTANSTH